MIYYCPQCGTRVLQGASVCPQCGVTLRFVLQAGDNSNKMTASTAAMLKKRSFTNPNSIQQDAPESDLNPILKYNEYATAAESKVALENDDDMSIIGITDAQFAEEFESELFGEKHDNDMQNKTTIGNIVPEALQGTGGANELSKYKIITQVFDKRLGFNATELEEKLNMYAQLGYRIVPNTMICQPGQDFFALMERTIPEAHQPQTPNIQPLNAVEKVSVNTEET